MERDRDALLDNYARMASLAIFWKEERWITQALATPSEILKQKTVEESEIKWKVAHWSAPFFTATQIR